jgi:polysaccharide export outer membrane protein
VISFFKNACFFLILFSLLSCKVYKQDILFQSEEGSTDLSESVDDIERNYVLQPNDWIEAFLFYNRGEQLIDPNFQPLGGANASQQNQNRQTFQYLIQSDGSLKLPMIPLLRVSGLTVDEAESIIEESYNVFFKDSFMKVRYLNKRVTVLGAINTVVPLTNESTSLLEVIALAGGIQFGSKSQNIRIIRGDLTNPEVFLVDLSTVQGMRQSMISVLPGDVIYIEPWRRTWLQGLRDVAPVLGITSSVATLVFLIVNTANNVK